MQYVKYIVILDPVGETPEHGALLERRVIQRVLPVVLAQQHRR